MTDEFLTQEVEERIRADERAKLLAKIAGTEGGEEPKRLAMRDLRGMSVDQINSAWDEVSEALVHAEAGEEDAEAEG